MQNPNSKSDVNIVLRERGREGEGEKTNLQGIWYENLKTSFHFHFSWTSHIMSCFKLDFAGQKDNAKASLSDWRHIWDSENAQQWKMFLF